ncbi:MAG: penicillin-binding transpeptidase domain-containing protein [Nevskiales bacterium]
MLRRHAITALLSTAFPLRAQKSLTDLIPDAHAAALLVDVPTRRLLAVHGASLAAAALLPPGSTMKPFALAALLESGKLRPDDAFHCPGQLMVGDRPVVCAHAPLGEPLRVRTALAYSCNCFVANAAVRFQPGELALALARIGMASRTGWFGETEAAGQVPRAESKAATQLQAIGEAGVLITPAELALAYRHLALTSARRGMEAILAGLEDAVEFGTAQRAKVAGLTVAGKTGSIHAADGAAIAWFAGFAPSRSPAVAITVMLQARSGGTDAAPIAGRILEAHLKGRL